MPSSGEPNRMPHSSKKAASVSPSVQKRMASARGSRCSGTQSSGSRWSQSNGAAHPAMSVTGHLCAGGTSVGLSPASSCCTALAARRTHSSCSRTYRSPRPGCHSCCRRIGLGGAKSFSAAPKTKIGQRRCKGRMGWGGSGVRKSDSPRGALGTWAATGPSREWMRLTSWLRACAFARGCSGVSGL
eukprot:5919466-Prymnesium_polylepis.1